MTKRARLNPHAGAKHQVRGEALDGRIETVIQELAAHAKTIGATFIYNASRVAKRVPCTRKTLARHDHAVERILADLAARRRVATGEATAEHLRSQVARLREQLAERDKVIRSLRSAHVEVYTRFHNQSLPATLLIEPVLESTSGDIGRCILCGSPWTKSDKSTGGR